MTKRYIFNGNGCGYITQHDLIAINAALQEGANVRIYSLPNGAKIVKEKTEVISTKKGLNDNR